MSREWQHLLMLAPLVTAAIAYLAGYRRGRAVRLADGPTTSTTRGDTRG